MSSGHQGSLVLSRIIQRLPCTITRRIIQELTGDCGCGPSLFNLHGHLLVVRREATSLRVFCIALCILDFSAPPICNPWQCARSTCWSFVNWSIAVCKDQNVTATAHRKAKTPRPRVVDEGGSRRCTWWTHSERSRVPLSMRPGEHSHCEGKHRHHLRGDLIRVTSALFHAFPTFPHILVAPIFLLFHLLHAPTIITLHNSRLPITGFRVTFT